MQLCLGFELKGLGLGPQDQDRGQGLGLQSLVQSIKATAKVQT